MSDNPEGSESNQEMDVEAQGENLAPPFRTDGLMRHETPPPPAYFVARRFQGNIPPPDLLQDYEKCCLASQTV